MRFSNSFNKRSDRGAISHIADANFARTARGCNGGFSCAESFNAACNQHNVTAVLGKAF